MVPGLGEVDRLVVEVPVSVEGLGVAGLICRHYSRWNQILLGKCQQPQVHQFRLRILLHQILWTGFES